MAGLDQKSSSRRFYFRVGISTFLMFNLLAICGWIVTNPSGSIRILYVNYDQMPGNKTCVLDLNGSVLTREDEGSPIMSGFSSNDSARRIVTNVMSGEMALDKFLSLQQSYVPGDPKIIGGVLTDEITNYYYRYSKTCQSRDTEIVRDKSNLPLCACLPSTLEGKVFDKPPSVGPNASKKIIEKVSVDVKPGGWWKPSHCQPRWKVAIIIPYRNREAHLNVLLTHVHPFLQHQQLQYRIFVIEQGLPEVFNRASLMNVGILEALKLDNFDCLIFHDVDITPVDGRGMYTCEFSPLHLGAYLAKFNFKLPYHTYFGGVTAMTTSQVKTINGFSNEFFGWGGEDDDHRHRVSILLPGDNVPVYRYPRTIGKSYMVKHQRDHGNEAGQSRWSGTKPHTPEYYKSEGLNSIKYTVVRNESLPLVTWIKVDLNKSASHEPCMNAFLNCWETKSLQKGLTHCCVTGGKPSCCQPVIPRYTGRKKASFLIVT